MSRPCLLTSSRPLRVLPPDRDIFRPRETAMLLGVRTAYPTIYVIDSAGVIRACNIPAASLPDLVEKLVAESAK